MASQNSSSLFVPSPEGSAAAGPSGAAAQSPSLPLLNQEHMSSGLGGSSRRRIPAGNDDDDDDDNEENAARLYTRRGQATEMPERSAQHQTNVERLVSIARDNEPAIIAAWERMKNDYWTMAKAKYHEGETQSHNRDVRDFVAAVIRTTPPRTLEATIAVVFRDLPARLRNGTTLAGSFETARQAVTESLRSAPGADRHLEVSKWKMFLWFGPEITTTVRQIKKISALLRPTKKSQKITFDELTNRLWRKVFAENGDDEDFPWPTKGHLKAVVLEAEAEKTAADEAEAEARRERELRREQELAEREARRNRRLPSQPQPQGAKRTREGENDDEDNDGEDLGERPTKRSRLSRRGEGEGDDGLGLGGELDGGSYAGEGSGGGGGGDEEMARGAERELEFLEEMDGGVRGETAREIDDWLTATGNRRWARLLEGPADPSLVLPDDVEQQFVVIQAAVRAVTTRLRQVRDDLA